MSQSPSTITSNSHNEALHPLSCSSSPPSTSPRPHQRNTRRASPGPSLRLKALGQTLQHTHSLPPLTDQILPLVCYPRCHASPFLQSATATVSTEVLILVIDNDLGISHINVDQEEGICRFAGVDGSFTVIIGEGTEDVGPPQVQVSGRCSAFSCIGFPINC